MRDFPTHKLVDLGKGEANKVLSVLVHAPLFTLAYSTTFFVCV